MSFNKSMSAKKWILMVAAAIATCLVAINLSVIVSHAESSGKITADGVNIRKEASASSEKVGSKAKGESIKIIGQVSGSDGYTWYKISLGGSDGYVRSDLATITDGSIPDTIGPDGTVTSGDDSINKVNPVSGSVIGGQAVRVRQDASTSSTIVASADSGTSLTVNGTKDGSDSRTWYFVSFDQDGSTVSGFIRSDFIQVNGELTPLGSDAPVEQTPVDTGAQTEVQQQKPYETQLEGDAWYLFDYANGQKYSIDSIFSTLDKNNEDIAKQKKSIATLRAFMIIFLILAIVAIAAAAFLFLKLRESGDQAIFAALEKGKAKAGANKAETGRPAGTRPAGQQGRPAPGQRPASGQRPAGPQGRPVPGQRPAGPQGRPVPGQRPAGPQGRPAPAPGQRPVGPQGRPAPAPGQRPVGPQGRPAPAPGQRTVSVNGQRTVIQEGQKISQAPERPIQTQERPVQPQVDMDAQPVRPQAPRPQAPQGRPVQNPNPAPRTQTADDDDFEFGFLNWDGDNK